MENEDYKKIVIYGLGNNFQSCFTGRVIDNLEKRYRIIGLVDKYADLHNSIYNGYTCYRCVPNEGFDYICITSDIYYDEIKEELLEQSINEQKILPKDYWINLYQSSYLPMDIIYGRGVEIGGPSGIFQVIYNSGCSCDGVNYDIETVWGNNADEKYRWDNKVIGKQIIADATDLQLIDDETYDFVLSSNNLEHIANPLKAIREFLRILKKDCPLIILVPCKEYTFDHLRENTTFEHILDDYNKSVMEDDLTHLEEILDKHDLALDIPAGTKEQFRERSINNYKNRCLHHHVFSNELLEDIANYYGLDIVENTIFGQNYYLAAIKRGDMTG